VLKLVSESRDRIGMMQIETGWGALLPPTARGIPLFRSLAGGNIKWSTVQSKASKGSNFAMDDTSKKSEPAVRRVVWGRQFLASTVVVPPDVAEHLNTDAMAVLAVIRNEAQASGKCSLPLARIAERANIGRAKARAAIRLAEGLGLIAIEETPDRKRVIVNRGVTSRC
jgi:hypothetical protein